VYEYEKDGVMHKEEHNSYIFWRHLCKRWIEFKTHMVKTGKSHASLNNCYIRKSAVFRESHANGKYHFHFALQFSEQC
jgi:hypothetical protein